MRENARIALISASAALVGGVIAGGASLATTALDQNVEEDRIERHLDEQTRGTARVLISRLSTDYDFLRETLQRNSYQRFPPGYFVADVTAEDLKLIGAQLSATGFIRVDLALRDAAVATVLARERLGNRLSEEERGVMKQFKSAVATARRLLYPVADFPRLDKSKDEAEKKDVSEPAA